jgi:hypothetical protein
VTPEQIALAAFTAVAAFFVHRIVRYGGLRGAMFGRRVLETLGEVHGARQGPVAVKLKIHVLGDRNDAERAVGLELVAKSFASWQMMPITLPRSEAQKLLSLLHEATSGR